MTILSPALEREFLTKVRALSFPAYMHLVELLLKRLGLEDIQLAGRTSAKGPNANGGYDLACLQAVAGGKRRLIVRIKQYAAERPVFQRDLDELRGVALRTGAAEVMLITTGTFSPTLDPKRLASSPILPARLIDGADFAELCALHTVGTWEEASTKDSEPAKRGVDTAFFARLAAAFPTHRSIKQSPVFLQLSLCFTPRRIAARKKAALPQRS